MRGDTDRLRSRHENRADRRTSDSFGEGLEGHSFGRSTQEQDLRPIEGAIAAIVVCGVADNEWSTQVTPCLVAMVCSRCSRDWIARTPARMTR